MSKQLFGTALLFMMLSPLRSASPQAGPGSIDGIIVRIGTSEPLAEINVEMRRVEGTGEAPLLPLVYPSGESSPGAVVIANAPNPGDSFYAKSGGDGRFTFTNLKPGKYRLLAAHPGGLYYPAEYGQRNPRGPGYDFSLRATQVMRIRMEMAPMASVSGHITGSDGKPVAHAHVFAAEIAYQYGERVLNQMQGVESDDRGDYRLFWLPPGRYVIGAFPEGLRRRVYSNPFGPPAQVESLNQTYPQALIQYSTGANGDVVEEVYQIVYAPGDVNPVNARILDLRLGSTENGIDLSLASGRQRAVRVRGTIVDINGMPASNVSVRAVPRIDGPVTFAPTATTDSNGAFTIEGLMPGDYLLAATINGANNTRTRAVQALNVQTANVDGLTLTPTAGMEIPGRIRGDAGTPEGLRIGLTPEIRNAPAPTANRIVGDAFSITQLLPGNYRVSVFPNMPAPSFYVKSIQLGGAEAIGGMIRIDNATPGPLEIVLGRNGGTLEGRVSDAQRQAVPNALVVMVPVANQRPDLFKTTSTDLSGHFRIQGLAPGAYLAFAWPWAPNGIWQNAEFLRSVEGQGQKLTISENANGDAELALLPEPN